MKKIFILLLFLPFFGYSQTVSKPDTSKSKVVIIEVYDEDEDDIYTETPFKGQEEVKSKNPYEGLTEHEIYNLKLKVAAKKEKTLKYPK
jgi:hypothetical protein